MNRICLSAELIHTLIKISNHGQIRREIDLKITRLPVTVYLDALRLEREKIVLPFSAGKSAGKLVLDQFRAENSILEFQFQIVEFLLLKIGIEYFGLLLLLSILNLFGFTRIRRQQQKITIDLTDILARNLPAGLDLKLVSLKIDQGIEVMFN